MYKSVAYANFCTNYDLFYHDGGAKKEYFGYQAWVMLACRSNIAFAEAGFKVVGYDTKTERIIELLEGYDKTFEVENRRLKNSNMTFTDKVENIRQANFHIIIRPTPITSSNEPDISYLIKASEKLENN